MYQKIDDLIASKFSVEEDDEAILLYSENGEYIGDALEQLFKDEGYESHEFSIEIEEVFSCPSGDYGYISIAFIDWGRLHHTVYRY